jgi:hypothetical protein
MSRRQHVVRTDDAGGTGVNRSLEGCIILCGHADCGSVGGASPEQLAIINVEAGVDYQRCFVIAAIGWVTASEPEP